MSKPLKVLTVVGARPQFVKAAAVSKEFLRNPKIEEILCHTGQHYDRDMSQTFFEELGIPEPKYHLKIGSAAHGAQTGRMLEALEDILVKDRPDWVLLYGDTNSTLAGALAASKLDIFVCHVEAGLRSFNRKMPEEINRVVTDHLAKLNLCPTEQAMNNLAAEGVKQGVQWVGDVMYDMVSMCKNIAIEKHNLAAQMGLKPKEYMVLTLHRPSNTDERGSLSGIIGALSKTKLPIVFPAHPRVKARLLEHDLLKSMGEKIKLINPASYFQMIALVAGAKAVLTDSGGLQKEARILEVPCVTLRDETEWVETLVGGWNRLSGADPTKIQQCISEVLELSLAKSDWAQKIYGNGEASQRIANALLEA